ncbi:MAG: hypothetical protein ACR2O6_00455 [Ilumatobacteraceae bacterium]
MADDDRHEGEVQAAYRAAARLRLYAIWAAAFGVVLVVAVVGAMVIGWMSVEDGLTWLGVALLLALVPAARFYADAARTTVNAAGLERSIDTGHDLYAGTDAYRARIQRLGVAGLVVAVVLGGTVAVFSLANAGSRTPSDDDDDDGDRQEQQEDSPPSGTTPPAGGDNENDD